jgi:tetratricopeptide (TPR) repeat protein
MTVTEYTYLINKPDAINDKQTLALEKILDDFPYFQSARAMRLKGLYNQDSFKYNNALKVTAGHSSDRTVLFDFITSDTFTAIQKGLYEQKVAELLDINVVESEIVTVTNFEKPNSIEKSILTSIKESGNEVLEKNLEIGKPLDFSRDEKHSFQEWLQLSRIQPIEREKNTTKPSINEEIDLEKKKKNELIDKFIETSPKIPQIDKNVINSIVFEPKEENNSYLMTETLAKVYLEQKKYQKAIQAYEILILKYPEKSSFFANRISDIKNLQQNNN